MMCEKCGEIIPDNAKVCPSCGTVAGSAAETAEQESYDALRDAMNGVISPEESAETYRKAAKPITRMFWWHVCTDVIVTALILGALGWIAFGDDSIWRTVSIVATVLGLVMSIAELFIVRSLGTYHSSFDEAASNMILGKFVTATFYYLCEGFARITVRKSPKLYSQWSGVFSSAIIMSILAIVLYLLAVVYMDKPALFWGFGLVSYATIAVREVRYLVLVRKTINVIKA
jgi:hypothetical protein